MYTSPQKKRLYSIVTLVMILLIPISVVAFFLYEDWRARADPEERPSDVRLSDVTETSAVISWITPDKAVEGWLLYSDQSGVADGSPLSQDDRDVRSGSVEKRTTHYVTLTSLSPDTTYYFVIGSGARTWKDPDGNEFTFKTAALGSDSIPTTPDPVFGTVTNASDQNAIIYITLQKNGIKSSPVSTLVNDQGNFEVDLSHIRNANLDDKFLYDDGTEMIIFAQGGDFGGAVLRMAVGDTDAISLTMAEDYPETDIFADTSGIDVEPDDGGDSSGSYNPKDTTAPNDTTDSNDTADPDTLDDTSDFDTSDMVSQYPVGMPTTRHDVPLIKLVLGASTVETGISNIQLTNVTENSFSVVWTSAEKETGSIVYGTSTDDIGSEAWDTRDSVVAHGEYYTHSISVGNLTPETTYYYEIHSGDLVYDNSGDPYEITVPATEDSPPSFFSLFGEVTGTGAQDAILVARISGKSGTSSYISSPVQDNGTWTLSLGGIRTQDHESYYAYSSDDTLAVTVRTRGNSVTEEYILGDVTDDIIEIEINMAELPSSASFNRGLYSYIADLANLPETAVSKIVSGVVVIGLLLIAAGTLLLIKAYSKERSLRWEQEVLREVE